MPNEVGGDVHGQVVQAGHVGRIDLHSAPAPLTALSGLPPATTVFCGRAEEMTALRAAWSSDGPAVVSSAVAGLAGIGKTELVLRAAHQALADGDFPGGALFVDLQGYDATRRVSPAQALDSFLRALGVDGQSIPPGEDQRATLFRSMLTGRPPVLIVLDNASSTAQVRPLLPGGRHRVVITSRHTLTGLDEARHLDLGVLDPAEATDLVGDPRLAALCGHLPLALRIMRALAAADPRTDWAAELTDARHRLELLDDGDSRAVHAAFDLSYRSLGPDLRRLFRLLSLHPTDEFSLEGAAALADRPMTRTRALLRELVRAHLVEPGATPDWFTFHDLVRLYAHRCAEGDPETDPALSRMFTHYATKAGAAKHQLSPRHRGVTSHFQARQDALAWLDRTWLVLAAAARLVAERELYDVLFPIVESLCSYFDTYRHPDEMLAACLLALDGARASGRRLTEASVLTELGNAYARTREYDLAVVHLETALELNRALGNAFATATTLNDLGTAYRKTSRLDDAHHAYTEALATREEIGDRYGAAQTMNNLGNTLRDLGRAAEASEFYQRSLRVRQEIDDRHGMAQVLNNLGTAQVLAGEVREAFGHYRESLLLYRELGHQFREAGTLFLLGNACGDTRPAAATAFWRAALSLYERLGAEQEAQDVRDRLADLHDIR
ncbi:tetratricopeptide repeat protein [Lentzea sp. NPDC059081]|uniref:tetratricopeptide repeat protein n=1 Tax=Lentzea sp. NPDC059081 TaxID=3346719 RepID=UPI003695E525